MLWDLDCRPKRGFGQVTVISTQMFLGIKTLQLRLAPERAQNPVSDPKQPGVCWLWLAHAQGGTALSALVLTVLFAWVSEELGPAELFECFLVLVNTTTSFCTSPAIAVFTCIRLFSRHRAKEIFNPWILMPHL